MSKRIVTLTLLALTASLALSACKGSASRRGRSEPLIDSVVHVPEGLAPGQKVPLLLMLHGLGGSGEELAAAWAGLVRERKVAWLAPNGPTNSQGQRYWNAGPACCDADGSGVDHVAQLRALLEKALRTHPIDRESVFVVGYSNGGYMAHRLGCAAPELVRGIASIAGSDPLVTGACAAPESLRVLQVHGDKDSIVPYEGGLSGGASPSPPRASALRTAQVWAERLGCSTAPAGSRQLDLEPQLPGAETQIAEFTGCERGKVELWTVAGAGHQLGFHERAPPAIWSFLNP